MDPARNPYAPGAGTPPPLMAGRDDLVSVAEVALTRAKLGKPAKGFVAVGLRGVGKTVVLNKIQDIADNKGYQSAFLEAEEELPLVRLLVPQLRRILFKLDRAEGAHELVRRSLRVLKGFVSALKVQYGDFQAGLDFDSERGVADSGDLTADLPELFLALGEAAAARQTAIALIVDEIQYLSERELGALVGAVHKANQKQLPIVVVGAGLPQVLARMGNAKSYAERLFEFPKVAALSEADAKAALVGPATDEGVAYDERALAEIVRLTQGYPYFLQEWGYVTWNMASSSPITREHVLSAGPEALRRLDQGFFRMRLDRMTPTEKKYIRAMAELGPGPHRSGDIAATYGAQVTTVAPIRSSLISKGMIYSPAHGETAFTVPLFDEFMRREIPDR
ncbi:MAG: ATP-binding protein, partial [Verrucomicrobia bacterium]|nr:ATP-binding protein [Verrucomicrobiota bacterium]